MDLSLQLEPAKRMADSILNRPRAGGMHPAHPRTDAVYGELGNDVWCDLAYLHCRSVMDQHAEGKTGEFSFEVLTELTALQERRKSYGKSS